MLQAPENLYFNNSEALYFLGIGSSNAPKIQQCIVQLSTKPPGHDLPSNCSLALLPLRNSFSRHTCWASTKYYCLLTNISQKRKCCYPMAKWLQKSLKTYQTQVPAFPQDKEIQTPNRGADTILAHCKTKGKYFILLKWFNLAWHL